MTLILRTAASIVATGRESAFCGIGRVIPLPSGSPLACRASPFQRGRSNGALMAMANHSMRNWKGLHVGDVRATDVLFG